VIEWVCAGTRGGRKLAGPASGGEEKVPHHFQERRKTYVNISVAPPSGGVLNRSMVVMGTRSVGETDRAKRNVAVGHLGHLLSLLVMAACASPPLVPQSACCYEFQVQGDLSITNYNHASTWSSQFYKFQLSVSNLLWQMHADDYNLRAPAEAAPSKLPRPHIAPSSAGKGVSLTLLAGTDGEAVYGYSLLGEETANPTVQGFVTPGVKPQFNRDLQFIWMALASADYLDNPTNVATLHPPWDIYPSELTNSFLIAEVERDPRPPRLPLQILFHRVKRSPGGGDGEKRLIGRYRVLTATNYGNLSLPTHCLLERFTTSGSNSVASEFLLNVATVGTPAIASYVPRPIDRMLVLDYRFRDNSLGYGFTPYNVRQTWKPQGTREASAMAEERKRVLKGAISGKSAPPAQGRLVLALLLFTMITPPLIYLYYCIKPKIRQHASANDDRS
jgi:hypothetical protein